MIALGGDLVEAGHRILIGHVRPPLPRLPVGRTVCERRRLIKLLSTNQARPARRYVAGAVIAVADGLASAGQAVSRGTYLSAPGPLIAVQAAAAVAALRGHRAGAIALTAASTLSLAAAAFDGDVGSAGLSSAEVALQAIEVALIAAVWAFAAALATRRAEPASA